MTKNQNLRSLIPTPGRAGKKPINNKKPKKPKAKPKPRTTKKNKIISSYVGGHQTNQPYNPNAITYYTPTPGSSIPATTLTNKSNYELASYKDILSNKSSVDSYLDMLTKKRTKQDDKQDVEKEQNTNDINAPRKRTGSFDKITNTFDKTPIKALPRKALLGQEYYKKTGIPAKPGMTIDFLTKAIKEHDEKRHDIHEVFTDDPLPFVNHRKILGATTPSKTELKQLKKEQKAEEIKQKKATAELIKNQKIQQKEQLKADKESKKSRINVTMNNNLPDFFSNPKTPIKERFTLDEIYPEVPSSSVKSLIERYDNGKTVVNPLVSKTRKATIAKPVVIINKDGTMRASRSKK